MGTFKQGHNYYDKYTKLSPTITWASTVQYTASTSIQCTIILLQ